MKKTKLEPKMIKELTERAVEMLKYSYTPYSGFKVGAAILTKTGKIYSGCNVENAAYSPCICAERTAIFKAVSEGEKEFEAIAIVGGKEGIVSDFCPPCGTCRQVMREFCEPEDFEIILSDGGGTVKIFSLAELLPMGFGLS